MSLTASHRRPDEKIDAGRRALLGRLLGDAAPGFSVGRGPLPAARIALVREIAARSGSALPAGAVPEVFASDACVGHGVCTSVCPTGALRRFDEPGFAGIEFEAAECLACGACVVVCPEEALSLEASTSAPGKVERITNHALRMCARCDDEFTARGDEDLCPACRKDIGLFTTGFSARSDEP